LGTGKVSLGVGVDERHEWAALRTPLAHIDAVVAQENFGIDDAPAIGANAAGQLMEHITRIDAMTIHDRFLMFARLKNCAQLRFSGRSLSPRL
jgi:hypothetical protein